MTMRRRSRREGWCGKKSVQCHCCDDNVCQRDDGVFRPICSAHMFHHTRVHCMFRPICSTHMFRPCVPPHYGPLHVPSHMFRRTFCTPQVSRVFIFRLVPHPSRDHLRHLCSDSFITEQLCRPLTSPAPQNALTCSIRMFTHHRCTAAVTSTTVTIGCNTE